MKNEKIGKVLFLTWVGIFCFVDQMMKRLLPILYLNLASKNLVSRKRGGLNGRNKDPNNTFIIFVSTEDCSQSLIIFTDHLNQFNLPRYITN